jgi:DNA-binding NtrC family response regulator
MLRALIVDDDRTYASTIADAVGAEGLTASTASTLADARAHLAAQAPDVLLLDLNLPDGSGLDLLEELGEPPGMVVVIITGHATIDSVVAAMRRGASHYLTKPVDLDQVRAVLASVAQVRELKTEVGQLRTELRRLGHFGPMIGVSEPMQHVYELIGKAAPTNATVLLIGETGTGKELAARAIHDLSRRKSEPFVTINCGAVSPTLIESELFGHEKGSFTGADRRHRGVFERADEGTILLDEITEMPIDLQVKLLRVLETKSFLRVGGHEAIDADVRVVAATNRNPKAAVAEGKLREDLYYRLNVFPIELPPLRERGEDIELLARHFLARANEVSGQNKELSSDLLSHLHSHNWPGNVRELANTIERAFIVSGDQLSLGDASGAGAVEAPEAGLALHVGMSLAEAERSLVLATLEHCGGDKKAAAETLGISLKTLYNRIREYKGESK